MTLYKIGEIVYKKNKNIILESYGTGYLINIANPDRYEVNTKLKLYLMYIYNDYNHSFQIYGFKDFMERALFNDLINTNGIGPKIAINILDKGWKNIAALIGSDDIKELSKLAHVNEKMAKNLVISYHEKWAKINGRDLQGNVKKASNLSDLSQSLKMLGFKEKQISYALSKVDNTDKLEDMIEKSIQLIANKYHEQRPTT